MVYSCFVIATVRLLLSSSFFPPQCLLPVPGPRPRRAIRRRHRPSMPTQTTLSTPPTGAIMITSLTMLNIQGVTTARPTPQTPATPQATTMTTMATTNIVSAALSWSPLLLSHSWLISTAALQDTDSDPDVYQRPAPSSESLGPPPGGRMGYPDSSTPTFMDYGGPAGAREAYPAWSAERQIPLSKEEIEDIFLDLTQKFGFQRDSMRNMVRFFVSWPPMFNSRACQAIRFLALSTATFLGGFVILKPSLY